MSCATGHNTAFNETLHLELPFHVHKISFSANLCWVETASHYQRDRLEAGKLGCSYTLSKTSPIYITHAPEILSLKKAV